MAQRFLEAKNDHLRLLVTMSGKPKAEAVTTAANFVDLALQRAFGDTFAEVTQPVTIVFSQGKHSEGVQPQLNLTDKTGLILMPSSDRSPFQDPVVLSALTTAATAAIVLEGNSRLSGPATDEDMRLLVKLGTSVGSALLVDAGLLDQQKANESVLRATVIGYSHPLFSQKR